jgi:chromosome segregation ATPase
MTQIEDPLLKDCLSAIDELMALIKEEISDIEHGRLDRLGAHIDRKRSLLARIEPSVPVIQAELAPESKVARILREKLVSLRAALEKDLGLVEKMSTAARDLSEEIARIQRRHSLTGVYSASGALQPDPLGPRPKLDQTL